MPKVMHPHITSDSKIYGGSGIIHGTRFPVRSVVLYVLHHGLTPEELVVQFSHLTMAQVYDALAYYYDNREEIEKDIAENTEEAERLTELTCLLKTDAVDLIVLNDSPPLLQHRVLRDNRLIYCRDHRRRLHLEFRMLQEYLDLQPFYTRQSRSMARRILEGRFAVS